MRFFVKSREKTIRSAFWTALPIVFFIFLLAIGFVLHDDYGGYTDEMMEVQTAAINAKAIFATIPFLRGITSLPIPVYGDLSALPNLMDYEDLTYGTAVMLPTLFVNNLPGISLNLAQFLNFRRLFVFLNFWLAMVCFYGLIQVRFQKKYLSFAAVVMLTLSPRFFAESFYNCKDIIFFSWFLISLCGLGLGLLRSSHAGFLLFCLGFALTTNTRYYGAVLLPFALGLIVMIGWGQKQPVLKIVKTGWGVTLISLLLFYAVSPYLWSFNIQRIADTLHETTNQMLIGDAELFMGKFVAPRDIWYTIPVWMGITIPILYLLLFWVGSWKIIQRWISQWRAILHDPQAVFDSALIALLISCWIGIALTHATLYHGWRHAYFLYAPFLYLSICGLNEISAWQLPHLKMTKVKNWVILLVFLTSSLLTGRWMVINHPLDFIYFNEVGRHFADQFTRDYWGVASRQCLLDLARDFNGTKYRLALNEDFTWGSAEISLFRLPENLQERFDPVWQTIHSDTICFSHKNILGNDHPIEGFEIIKTYRVDGYDVAAIYRRISDE